MPSSPGNDELAAALDEYAALLDVSGANSYATRAYRRAAGLIRETPADVAALVREGHVRRLRGIGPEERRFSLESKGRVQHRTVH